MPSFSSARMLISSLALVALTLPASAGIDWPGLRGPSYDGAVRDVTFLDADASGLEVGWIRDIGPGYSAIAVGDGRAVTMFASGEQDVIAAFDVESGDELWRYVVGRRYVGHDGSHDGPIATPTLAGERVFGLGARGRLFALEADSGKEIWATELVEEHEARKPHYGFSASPLVVGDVLVIELGAGEGKAMAGFNVADGSLLWTVGDDRIDYQSPIVASISGRLQVLAAGDKRLYGLDPASGEVLWSYEHQGDERAIGAGSMIPLPAGENRFLLMNKADGSAMLSIELGEDETYRVTELWANNSIRGSYVTPVYHEGFLYGMTGRVMTCVDAATGETHWKSREPGDGFPTLIGDQLAILTKPGSLHVAAASPEGYQELARIELFDEHAWSEVAFAGGRLFARSMGRLARIDAAAEARPDSARASWISRTEFGRFLDGLGEGTERQEQVDRWFESQESFPVVESPDVVHFVYRGDAADMGIMGDMIGARREEPMTRVEGTDLFYYSVRLEPNAAITYGFITDYGDPRVDPLNPRKSDGLEDELSFFSMPMWEEPRFRAEADSDRQGTLELVEWESAVHEGATRKARVYLPIGYDATAERDYPVVYFHGGEDVLTKGDVKNALDNLIGERLEPVIGVFPLLDEENPRRDLSVVDTYLEMVVSELVPLIDGRYRTQEYPHGRASVGIARGGAVALYSGLKYPDLFGRVGSQSAVYFVRTEQPLAEMVHGADQQPLSIYMGWGSYQLRSPHEAWDTAEENRELWATLRERGFRPSGGETPEGTGWTCWGGRTGEMLAMLFPQPR